MGDRGEILDVLPSMTGGSVSTSIQYHDGKYRSTFLVDEENGRAPCGLRVSWGFDCGKTLLETAIAFDIEGHSSLVADTIRCDFSISMILLHLSGIYPYWQSGCLKSHVGGLLSVSEPISTWRSPPATLDYSYPLKARSRRYQA